MLASTKSLSLIEQKKLQWAKEREEMVGLYGLWGRPRNNFQEICPKEEKLQSCFYPKNLLPPIQGKKDLFDESIREIFKAEESETSGYLSDSPKHLNQIEPLQNCEYFEACDDQLNNETVHENIHQQYWNEIDKTENFWEDKKMYKNYKNENWAHQNTESVYQQCQKIYPVKRNNWYGTPESISSDDGSRLRWGDRGVGIGHLWDPVVSHPDCRLPKVTDPYRQTPKWVEKGLKKTDGNQADILIIHHPDDDLQPQKNFILGQNAPIPVEVIEERERKRKKALEHQNAIKKQLEERELKRKQEKENRIREERIEEERIKKEQEIERLRYEEEQKKIKQKEEIEKKKEEAMREAIELAEKRAREEKKRKKRYLIENSCHKNISTIKEKTEKLEKILEKPETGLCNRRHDSKTSDFKKSDDMVMNNSTTSSEKILKDSCSQFEEIQLVNNFQFLNVNGLPIEGGLALMLENPPRDNNIIFPPDCVQLALLMSPRNVTSSDNFSLSSSLSVPIDSRERILTPSKYRISERSRFVSGTKATQTDFKCLSNLAKPCKTLRKGLRQNKKSETNSSGSGTSQKANVLERHHKHIRCFISSKHRLKSQQSKMSLEDRPKWGINRPSVQYKKQSEKDPNYQRKIRERLKKVADNTSPESTLKNEKVEDIEEKELDSVARLLECQTDDEGKSTQINENIVLQNGYRMNSNLSSPVFVPIDSNGKLNFQDSISEIQKSNCNENEDGSHVDDDSTVGFLTRSQFEAIKQIASLREGLKQLQKDYSTSRSITPFSDKSIEK